MTNVDDTYAELAHAKEMLRRRDYDAALEAIVQAEKLWSAEVLYWRCELEDMQKQLDGTERALSARDARLELVAPSHWHRRELDWRGDDYMEGASE